MLLLLFLVFYFYATLDFILFIFFFFFKYTATTEISTSVHTLSLHDALPISARHLVGVAHQPVAGPDALLERRGVGRSEEHTSELQSRTLISYAVFCLTK